MTFEPLRRYITNPRRACARVLAMSVCVCVSVCLYFKALASGASVLPENADRYSAGNVGGKIYGVVSETASFQSYGTSAL